MYLGGVERLCFSRLLFSLPILVYNPYHSNLGNHLFDDVFIFSRLIEVSNQSERSSRPPCKTAPRLSFLVLALVKTVHRILCQNNLISHIPDCFSVN
jgi:hypothetical protein